ncbi:hypothetical protein BGZ51_008003 [Haplosporangium sp. Z 767]|nr:hypothetical protein BGZ51_008003 [Haplosporangium sp. Z 767]
MTRITLLPIVLMAALAVFSQAEAQSSTTKPECASLHSLYKTWVADCIKDGIPNADSDKAWQPCICKDGFFPLATANEACVNKAANQPMQITAESLNNLCTGYPNYVEATKQTEPQELKPALASATSIMQANPTPTGSAGGNDNNSAGGDAAKNAAGSLKAPANSVLMGITSFAAVVLVTAVAL